MDFIQRAHVHYQTPNSTVIELFDYSGEPKK
jgi:hypothetical protein